MISANRRGFLRKLTEPSVVVSHFFVTEVEHFSLTAACCKGVIDLFQADHFFCNFNAQRPCSSHRLSSIDAAWNFTNRDPGFIAANQLVPGTGFMQGLAELPMSVACCCGQALCGDFGSSSLRRYMCLGGVSSMVAATDRLAAAWGIQVQIDDFVHSDASVFWCCRLLERCVYPKRGSEKPFMLWEVVSQKSKAAEEMGSGEWMYQLSRTLDDPWDGFNSILQYHLTGKTDAAWDLRHGTMDIAKREQEVRAHAPPAVLRGFEELTRRLRSGTLGTLTLTEVVVSAPGEPAATPPPHAPAASTLIAEHIEAEASAARVRSEEQLRQQSNITQAVYMRKLEKQGSRVRMKVGKGSPKDDSTVMKLVRQAKQEGAPWGVAVDTGTMALRQAPAGSIGAKSETLAGCVGMKLMQVNTTLVHTPDDVEAVLARHEAVGSTLYLYLTTSTHTGVLAAPEDPVEVVVTLERKSFEAWLPWGIVIRNESMELIHCTAGSVAANSKHLQRCHGMVLIRVNDSDVYRTPDVVAATEEAAAASVGETGTTLRLLFRKKQSQSAASCPMIHDRLLPSPRPSPTSSREVGQGALRPNPSHRAMPMGSRTMPDLGQYYGQRKSGGVV